MQPNLYVEKIPDFPENVKYTLHMSRSLAESIDPLVKFGEDRAPALISINDPYSFDGPAKITSGWNGYISLEFPDTLIDPITEWQAKDIADFIADLQDYSILVHCRAGVSRSAAIVRLLVELGWEPLPGCFFQHANIAVYNAVKRALAVHFPNILPAGALPQEPKRI